LGGVGVLELAARLGWVKLTAEAEKLILAGTLFAAALSVASRRGVGAEMGRLLAGFGFSVVPVTEAVGRAVAAAYGL
jgi:ribonuclease VapC